MRWAATRPRPRLALYWASASPEKRLVPGGPGPVGPKPHLTLHHSTTGCALPRPHGQPFTRTVSRRQPYSRCFQGEAAQSRAGKPRAGREQHHHFGRRRLPWPRPRSAPACRHRHPGPAPAIPAVQRTYQSDRLISQRLHAGIGQDLTDGIPRRMGSRQASLRTSYEEKTILVQLNASAYVALHSMPRRRASPRNTSSSHQSRYCCEGKHLFSSSTLR